MAKTQRMVPHAWVEARDKTIAELEAVDERWIEGVNALLKQHKPYGESEIFKVGWTAHVRSFYCERCRTPWPCRTFNELRTLYGHAHEWDGDQTPYAPLKLHPVEEPKEK